MIKLMRKNMKLIIWVMVIAFCSTMFIGTVYFRLFGKKIGTGQKGTNIPKDFKGEIAVVGDLPVDKMKFNEVINRYVEEMARKDPTMKFIDPDLLEYIRYNSYNQALQFTILLNEAKKQGIKAKRGEVNENIKSIIMMQNLKDKGQLKDLLKRNNYPYNMFVQNLKNNIMVQKLVKKLTEEVVITDKDINDYFKKVKARHILIKINEDKKGKKLEKEAEKKADEVYNEAQKGVSFEELAKKYSDDTVSKIRGGDLGWFGKGMMIPDFEKTAFSLKKNEISRPFKTIYGFHIVKVEGIKEEKPKSINNDKLKKQMEDAKRKQNFEELIGKAMENKKIEIFDSQLLAYKYKMSGEFDKAVNEYRSMIAENPTSPVPNYMAGKVLEIKGDLTGAKGEYEKAKVKQAMNKEYSFGEINIALGNIYKKEGNTAKALTEYDLASKSAIDRASVHDELSKIYKTMGLLGKAREEEAKVSELSKKADTQRQKIMDAIKKLKEKSPETPTKNK